MTLIQQQRIIGIILLACGIVGLAVFFISNATGLDSVPPKIIASNNSQEIVLDEDNKVFESSIEAIKPVKKSVETSVLGEEKQKIQTAIFWYLQIATFSIKANAQDIKKQVSALGYDAQITETKGSTTKLYRVHLKQTTNKSSLEAASLILNQKLGIRTQIIQK